MDWRNDFLFWRWAVDTALEELSEAVRAPNCERENNTHVQHTTVQGTCMHTHMYVLKLHTLYVHVHVYIHHTHTHAHTQLHSGYSRNQEALTHPGMLQLLLEFLVLLGQ